MTFAPCFLFIFTFAPYIEHIRGKKVFSYAFNAITASIVGVILNLSFWFVLNSLFSKSAKVASAPFDFSYPILSSVDPFGVTICFIAALMKFKWGASLFKILGFSVAIGIAIKFFI